MHVNREKRENEGIKVQRGRKSEGNEKVNGEYSGVVDERGMTKEELK
jgi:hypothetical protein